MSEVIKKLLDVEALKSQLQEGEKLQFLFVNNGTPHLNGGEHVNCKNGHWNFISNYMGFEGCRNLSAWLCLPHILLEVLLDMR